MFQFWIGLWIGGMATGGKSQSGPGGTGSGLLLEDGASFLLLEDGASYLLLEDG